MTHKHKYHMHRLTLSCRVGTCMTSASSAANCMPVLCATAVGTVSTSHIRWWIGQASSSNGITDVKGVIFVRSRRVIPSMDEKCVGVPSSGSDDWNEGGVEVPGYAPGNIAYRAEWCIHHWMNQHGCSKYTFKIKVCIQCGLMGWALTQVIRPGTQANTGPVAVPAWPPVLVCW